MFVPTSHSTHCLINNLNIEKTLPQNRCYFTGRKRLPRDHMMIPQSKRELLGSVYPRYLKSGKKKTKIADEFVAATGFILPNNAPLNHFNTQNPPLLEKKYWQLTYRAVTQPGNSHNTPLKPVCQTLYISPPANKNYHLCGIINKNRCSFQCLVFALNSCGFDLVI